MRVRLALVSLLVVCLVGCSGLMRRTMPDTPEARYFTALRQFNDMASDYIAQYDAAGPETQLKWKEEVTPAFSAASAALDIWGASIHVQGDDIHELEQEFITLRKQVFAYILKYGILEVEK